MNVNLTDITVILDRSGSMQSCKDDAEGGLNHFIAEQKKQPGQALFTLVQFDTDYEVVHKGKPIAKVPQCTLEPRGSTALLDAVGMTIRQTGQRLAAMPEADRPGLVLVVIITDGQENASHNYSLAQVKEMIQHQQGVYKWQFNYLGANQDAFAEAGAMGIAAEGIANYDQRVTGRMFDAMTRKAVRMRGEVAMCAPVSNKFTDEERAEMVETK